MNIDSRETDSELLRVANDMRKNAEPIPEQRERFHILWSNFETRLRNHDELVQSLSVLSPADTEATYEWLSTGQQDEASKRWMHDFVIANLREISGNRAEALAQYTSLRKQLQNTGSILTPYIDQAIKRLSAGK